MLIPGNEVVGELSYSSCPKCGVVIKDDMEYCGECGADLQQKCPGCGKRIRWHHKHCPKCGVNIELKHVEVAEGEKHRREESRIAEEKRKTDEARSAAERKQWWMRNRWKLLAGSVIAIVVVVALVNALMPRFTVKNGIIHDRETGLDWRVGPDRDIDWYSATSWIDGLGDGWRMPSISELEELKDAHIWTVSWGPFDNSGYVVWSTRTGGSSSDRARICQFGGAVNVGWQSSELQDDREGMRVFAVR